MMKLTLSPSDYSALMRNLIRAEMEHGPDMAPFYALQSIGVTLPIGGPSPVEVEVVVDWGAPGGFPVKVPEERVAK